MGYCIDLCDSGFSVEALPEAVSCVSEYFLADTKTESLVSGISSKVKDRLQFSKYIVNPFRFKFSKGVCVVSLVIKAAKLFLNGINRKLSSFLYLVTNDATIHTNHSVFENIGMKHDPSVLSDTELQYGLDYFFMKTTEEVKVLFS